MKELHFSPSVNARTNLSLCIVDDAAPAAASAAAHNGKRIRFHERWSMFVHQLQLEETETSISTYIHIFIVLKSVLISNKEAKKKLCSTIASTSI